MYCYNVIEKIRIKADIEKYFPKNKKCKKCNGNVIIDKKFGVYSCLNCGSCGNIFTALMDENKTFLQAIEYLAEKEQIELYECVYSEDEYEVEKCSKCNLFSN